MKKVALLLVCFLFFTFAPSVHAVKEIPILIYHSIAEYKGVGSKDLYVSPENFEAQIKYLRDNGFTLLTFEQWEERKRVDKPIFITFDDGYKNNLNAFTILRKLKNENFKPRATIFVISDFLTRTGRLSKADLKMMVDSGLISIQSHTATHPDLTKISHYKEELQTSKEKIQQVTGNPVIALAYPYGNFNDKVISETRKYYQFGLTTTPTSFLEKGIENEFFLLPRIYITYTTTIDEFAEIVEGKK